MARISGFLGASVDLGRPLLPARPGRGPAGGAVRLPVRGPTGPVSRDRAVLGGDGSLLALRFPTAVKAARDHLCTQTLEPTRLSARERLPPTLLAPMAAAPLSPGPREAGSAVRFEGRPGPKTDRTARTPDVQPRFAPRSCAGRLQVLASPEGPGDPAAGTACPPGSGGTCSRPKGCGCRGRPGPLPSDPLPHSYPICRVYLALGPL